MNYFLIHLLTTTRNLGPLFRRSTITTNTNLNRNPNLALRRVSAQWTFGIAGRYPACLPDGICGVSGGGVCDVKSTHESWCDDDLTDCIV